MTFARIDLESFESDSTGQPVQSLEYQRGFEAGRRAAETSLNAAKTNAVMEISATLSDMSFGFTEAREHTLNSVKPLFAQIAETVVPELLSETFGVHLIDTITAEFETHSKHPIEISVAPEAMAELSDLGSKHTRTPLIFIADNNLTAGQAILRQSEKHLMLDLAGMMEALQSALRGLESLERTISHG